MITLAEMIGSFVLASVILPLIIPFCADREKDKNKKVKKIRTLKFFIKLV
jgi:hypothetical protein